MAKTRLSKQDIENACWAAEIDTDDIRWDYSGRFMYGETAFGVVGSVSTFAEFLLGLTGVRDELQEEVWDLAARVRIDNYGLSSIFYFPGVEVVASD